MVINCLCRSQMSSQLTNLVPVLDGTNYQQWVAAMQSFLMSQGQWKCVKEGADVPSEIKVEDSVTNAAEIVSWLEDAEKAMGNIHLRLHHTIGYQFNSEENPATVRATLPYCSQCDSASYLARLVPLVTSGRLILDC